MSDIDCENRTHLCMAACCILGEVRDDDGNVVHAAGERCPHLTDDLKCAIYDHRPSMCHFDCRSRCTIWWDFERGVPNPDLGDTIWAAAAEHEQSTRLRLSGTKRPTTASSSEGTSE